MAKKQSASKLQPVEHSALQPQPVPIDTVEFKELEADFINRYASNIQFDPSIWGMRLIFGEYLLEKGKPVVKQHTAVTISWPQAKMLNAYLESNLLFHELANGKVEMPAFMLPPIPPEPPPQILQDPVMLAKVRKLQKAISDLRERMTRNLFADQKEE